MQRHIPNFLTCCNLLCGCLGILNMMTDLRPRIFASIFESPLISAAYFVWAACIFDFLDGFAARALKVNSPIGKELDSLADMVSFGLLPSLSMYQLLTSASHLWESPFAYLPLLAFLLAVCSALRLAIFNVAEDQSDSFRGLPTPANALFITSLPFLGGPAFIFNPYVLSVITITFSLLMVSRVELLALKFRNFTWAENRMRFTFLAMAGLLIAILGQSALPLLILLYIGFSLISKVFKLV